MQDTATELRTAVQEQVQRAYEADQADRFPPHPDVESAVSGLLSDLGEFYENEFGNALELRDPRWIDALAHACDEAREHLRAVKGEMQGPVKAKFIPEAV